MPHALALVPDEEFFGSVYRPLADTTSALARQLVALRSSTVLEHDIDPLLHQMQRLFVSAWRALGVDPPNNVPDTIKSMLQNINDIANILSKVTNNITVSDAIPLVRLHANYFEARFDLEKDYIEGKFSEVSKRILFFEVCFNTANVIYKHIFDEYRLTATDPRTATNFFECSAVRNNCPQESRAIIDACRTTLQGWCSDDKTWLLYHLVREAKPEVAVEIGIYGGRSIIPIARALRDNGYGTVTGVEAWTAGAATEQVTNLGNNFWWACHDYAVIKKDFFNFVLSHDMQMQVNVIEANSAHAHHCLGPIDFLHIDGNHSAFSASQDVVNYFSKLKPGGIIVFDDINWPSTHPALEIVMQATQLLHVIPVHEESTIPGCAAFRKI